MLRPEPVAAVVGVVVLVGGWLWPPRPASCPPGPRYGGSWTSGPGLGAEVEPRSPHRRRPARWAWVVRLLRGRRDADSEGLLRLLDILSPALRVGLAPVVALEQVAATRRDAPTEPVDELLADLIAHASVGRPLAPVWRRWAGTSPGPDLMLVASAWHLSESLGAPLVEAVSAAAAMVREQRTRGRRLDVALAGPRSTATVLSVLPLAGPAVAALFGIGPLELYGGPSLAAGAAGVVLLLVGRVWCRRLVASVSRPRALADSRRR